MTYMLSTDQLRWLNDEAVRKSANRALNDGFWSEVDPDGVHVVMMSLPYGRNSFGPCHRTVILCKMLPGKGSTTHPSVPAANVVIDIDYEVLEQLCGEDEPVPPLFDF